MKSIFDKLFGSTNVVQGGAGGAYPGAGGKGGKAYGSGAKNGKDGADGFVFGGVLFDLPKTQEAQAFHWVGTEEEREASVQALYNNPEVRAAYAKWKAKQP